MLDDWEAMMLRKVEAKKFLTLDALERAFGDLNECGLDKDKFSYAWIQLSRAKQNLDKIRLYVQALRTRRFERDPS